MRFIENGPAIPDELLTARDEGRVVFFCGAGVSRAYADLPDFFGLADKVVQRLRVPADNAACKILNEAQEISMRTGVNGLISADRIFGLLERDFLVRDIEFAVAKALQPNPSVDLTAHRLLLDLATTPEGKVRLVTTNFDRLFDDCDARLQVWQPPRLPDPSLNHEMDGIIYLHGCANKDYSGSEGDGFILTSSNFGRAYLAEGWATSFFREIIERYIVVFVGYAAEDPPVQYLLEALNKKERQLKRVYAFQAGETSEATARWNHKGVEAISYAEDNRHHALWETLEAWSVRAKSPDAWYQSVIDLAKRGPENLQAYQRGQVAHIISTLQGVRKFSEGDSPPSAEWLCVFDPNRRYAKPGHAGWIGNQGPFVDPFDLYGLDSDSVPGKILPEDYITKRDVPENAWNAFVANRLDRQSLHDDRFSSIWNQTPWLPPRLNQLGFWISKIADQPTTVWWAAKQNGLHKNIQQQIKWQLEHSQKDIPLTIHKAWGYLFESWERNIHVIRNDWYELETRIKKFGWDSGIVRKYAEIYRPYLKSNESFWRGYKPQENNMDFRLNDLLHLNVEYPDIPRNITVPDEWLAVTIRELRKNLELALLLETEIGGYALQIRSSIVPDDGKKHDHYERTHGLSACIIQFTSLFERLIKLDITKAHQEFATWPVDDDSIFSRLRIWAGGLSELVTAEGFGQIIMELTDNAFWDSYQQRDLLLVLAKRWKDLQLDAQKEIEVRLLNGREKYPDEVEDEYKERNAGGILNRITWLENNGCHFSFDVQTETKKLLTCVPWWKPEYATEAIRSMEGQGGFVRTDTGHSSLIHEPLSSVLTKSLELSGRTEEFLVEKAPFSGLSVEHPVRAFSALTDAARRNEYPEWAWRTFLNSEARKKDQPKFSALIAERIARCPDNSITDFIHPATYWLLKASDQLAPKYPISFKKLLLKLTNVLRSQPMKGKTSIMRGNKERDWVTEAINAPVGNIAKALFYDPRTNGLTAGGGFHPEWITHVEALLALDGELHRHAMVIFSHNLNWFYAIDPNWTEAHLLAVLEGNAQYDKEAFWAGFFGCSSVPNQNLYTRIKPELLAVAKINREGKLNYSQVLNGILLAGWGSINEKTQHRIITNDEMHDVLLHSDVDFLSNILWQLNHWSNTGAEEENKPWADLLPEFLRDVWPRQKSVKIAAISSSLCNLAFSNPNRFPELVETILPLLTAIDGNHLMLPNLGNSKDTIIDLYPRETLSLLYTVLPAKVETWPWGIEKIIQRISEADASLNLDERLIELKRKWNSR